MKLHRLTAQLVVGAILTLPVWVHAAGLGKLTVKSALGQPLSAEIELLVADKAELDSLNASLASGQAFKDAQIEYAPVLSTLQFTIGKGAGGKPVLKLTSSKPVNDPFMDMLIELNWASGRLLREYTVLLDPPGIAVPQTVSPVAVSAPVAKSGPAAVPAAPQPTEAGQYPVATAPAAQPEAAKPAPAAQETAAAEKAAPLESSVRVKRGDTLGKIANRVRPASVSLEQALVGLFRENPDAFEGGNMNRLKAGRSLKVPAAEAMAAVDQQEARREINLQASDWQAYRARLAESVAEQPAQEKEAPSKTVVGKITPKVEDKAQPKPEAAQDVLKLSKAAVPPVAAAKPDQTAAQKAAQEKALAEQKARAEQEDKAAREKALKESAERAATLEKQIQDMQKLADLKDQAKAAAAPVAQAAKTPPPAAAAPKVNKAPPPVEEPQASWYDELLGNPIYWIGGLAVVVLGGVLWWMVAGGRLRRKKMSEAVTDSLMTGDMQPVSVAGAAATGGVVNTGDTSFLTDFSQAGLAEIDTHDVDPIAEADVYMAYGRDAQAEEILKEALTKAPDRHEIRLKLLEIYAARKNVTAFETVAGELYTALGGQTGAVWDKAVEMGRAIDPHNPLYGGSPEPAKASQAAEPAPAVVAPAVVAAAEASSAPGSTEDAGAILDFTPAAPELDMDFKVPALEQEASAAEPVPAEPKPAQDLDFDLSGFDLKVPEAAPASEPAAAGAIDFSGLDLSLSDVGGEDEFDEVATKLDLARAYLEMGDKEGAREILQEVISEGNDRQKSDAQGIMATL
jgi:pilus assembly protein FimV